MHSHECMQGPRGPLFPAPSPHWSPLVQLHKGEERAENKPCPSTATDTRGGAQHAMGPEGGLFPNRPGPRLYPCLGCTELSVKTGSQPARNKKTPSPLSWHFSSNTVCAHEGSLCGSPHLSAPGEELQKCLLGFRKQEGDLSKGGVRGRRL